MEYRYKLAAYSGKQSRLFCPKCGKREFTPYIDSMTGEILDEICGRCNRESKCGYHLTPRQYFRQNPGIPHLGNVLNQPVECHNKQQQATKLAHTKHTLSPICELPKGVVDSTIRLDKPSNFVRFLYSIFDPKIVERLVYMYHIGAKKSGETVFYQMDGKGRYRGGKVMQYNSVTGHRIKEGDYPVHWITSDFQRKSYIPQDWKMTQCLYGEDLLEQYSDGIVCLVEAEKTAVICSGFMPEFVWVAVGGKTQLNDRLDVLRGREVIAFPDIDATYSWMEYFNGRTDLNVTVSMFLEKNATDLDREKQIDIADLLINWHIKQDEVVPSVPLVPSRDGTEQTLLIHNDPGTLEIVEYCSRKVMLEVAAFIDDFELIPISVQRIESTDCDCVN